MDDNETQGSLLYTCYEFAMGEQGIGIDPWLAMEQRERDAWELFAEKAEELMAP